VRVTYVLKNASDFERCWPILSATFGANPPAAMMIEAPLIDPRHLIEIELTAYIGTPADSARAP
jgi:enamine deaminase RidA (YjgF/YER057c/UK114 family)